MRSTSLPKFGFVFFGMGMVIYALNVVQGKYKFIVKLAGNREKVLKIISILVVVIGIAVAVYFFREYYYLVEVRAGSPNTVDRLFAILTLSLFGIAMLSFAPQLMIVVGIFVIYGLFGQYFPGILRFGGFTITQLIDFCVLSIDRGILGNLFQLGATLIAIFIIFAGFAQGSGGFDVLVRGASYLAKKSKYLVVETSVVGSAVMAMFSGSGTANVAATGSFTIPLMKSYNIKGSLAGAIEAVASAGGQIMPPVMGVSAFLMADFLGVPYLNIVRSAVLPALLFFIAVTFVAYHIGRSGDVRIPAGKQDELNISRLDVLVGATPMFLGLITLVLIMVMVKLHVMIAGFFAIIVLLVSGFVMHLVRSHLRKEPVGRGLKRFGKGVIEGQGQAATTVVEIALMVGLIQAILVIISSSGLSLKVSMLIMSLGEAHVWLILIIAAVFAIMLGCIVSTVAVYVLGVLTIVPALTAVGFEPLVAHMYVFWFAILGLITPPVAPDVIAACRIAESDFARTAYQAVRVGFGLLVVPITMILYPNLLIHDAGTLEVFAFTAMALLALATALFGGYAFVGRKGWLERVLLGFAGVALIVPTVDSAKYLLAVAVLAFLCRSYVSRIVRRVLGGLS